VPQLRGYHAAFTHVLKHHLPDVHAHFAALGISSDMFLMDWVLTGFSKAAPMDVAARVWDAFLMYGDYMLFRAALGILKLCRPALLQHDFEHGV
jgi:hypothetical protein